MTPQTREQLIQRIKEDLGEPVIQVNISRAQLENAIDDALDYWQQWHHEAQERTYLKLQITQEMLDTNKIPLPESVFSVVNILDPRGSGAALGWASYEFEMTRDAIYDSMKAGGGAGAMGTYVVTKQYLSDIQNLVRNYIPFDHRTYKGELYIFDNLSKYFNVGDWCILEVYGFLYKNGFNIWQDDELRKLATAHAKKTWGNNLRKFSGVSLPGGTLLNGESIYNDGVQEISDIQEFIRTLSEPYGICVV